MQSITPILTWESSPAADAKIELDLSKAIEVVRHQKAELQAGYFK